MRMYITFVLFAFLFLSVARGEDPQPLELKLHAQAIESPPLKYRLLPLEAELKPGNAVPILLRLPWEQTIWMNQVFPTLHEWNDRPLSAPEWQNSNGVLPANFYSEMKRAAYRREASWEYPLGEQLAYTILLPDVQGLRGFLGSGLSARIRYHLTRGETEQAREGILVGMANARHLAQTPFFVNQLVGIAIHRIMLDRTAELISQDNSPNLYWALSSLPDSLVEMDRAANFEASLFANTFPAVNDLDRPRDAREWRKMAGQLIELLEQLGEIPAAAKPAPAEDDDVLGQLLRRFGVAAETRRMAFIKSAREELPTLLNLPADKIAAMSDDEAGIRWYVYLRVQRDQKTGAVLMLSPREAWPRLKELQAEIAAMREKTGGKGFDFLNPTSIYMVNWSLRRKIESLRIIEAVRHYASSHEGRFPKTLAEIEEISIPLDPLTDRPFQWSVDGKTATLKAPPLPADAAQPGSDFARANVLEYRLNME